MLGNYFARYCSKSTKVEDQKSRITPQSRFLYVVGMLTTKKRLKSGFAFGMFNTSQRLLFHDQNFLNKLS